MKLIAGVLLVLALAACGVTANRGNHPAPCVNDDPTTCISGPGGPGSAGDGN